MEIRDQACVITGGASGMGAATAEHLAKLGAKVCILDRDEEGVKRVAEKIHGIGMTCDVTDADAVADAFNKSAEQHGPVRICVNCAGIAPASRIVGREGPMALEAFNQVIQVNLIGTFNVLRLAAAQMMASELVNDEERGVIVNTASVAAYEGQIGQAAYSASKGGVVALTLPAAREFGKFGIRVNTIAPGIMATPMMQAMPEAVQESLSEQIPFPKRLGLAIEYAKCVAHLVDNNYINGTVIRLDGAIRMQPK